MTVAINKPINTPSCSHQTMQTKKTWLNKEEQNELIDRISDTRDLSIIQILLNTGLTSSELCSLTWQDVTISHNKPSYLLVRVSGIEPTGHGRTIPLNQQACAAFIILGYPIHAGSETPIFIGQRGPLTPKGVLQILKKYVVGTSLHYISTQTLKNTFCRNLLENGMPPKKVASLAGYKNSKALRRCRLENSDTPTPSPDEIPMPNNTRVRSHQSKQSKKNPNQSQLLQLLSTLHTLLETMAY